MGLVPSRAEVKRLYRVRVEVEYESSSHEVYVWADDEDEAGQLAEEETDDFNFEPQGVERLTVEDVDEADLSEFERELKYHPSLWLPGTAHGETLRTMEATIRESLAEEERALEAWSAQSVLPGFVKPPLPSRCDECGARPPLVAHKETCSQRTSLDGGPCDADVKEGA